MEKHFVKKKKKDGFLLELVVSEYIKKKVRAY